MKRSLAVALLLVTTVACADIDVPLSGEERVGFAAFNAYVRSANPDADEIYLRTLYRHYDELCREEGVRLIVAIAQMILETNFLLFSGSVRAIQYNYAGLGAVAVAHPGLAFPNMRTGIAAHVQHMKAYADAEPLSTPIVDPRFDYVKRGSAPTVLALAGRWATDPHYGAKLIAHITRLRALAASES